MDLNDYEEITDGIIIENKCNTKTTWPFDLPPQQLLPPQRPFVCAFPLPSLGKLMSPLLALISLIY